MVRPQSSDDSLLEQWYEAEGEQVSGWDFEPLGGDVFFASPSWDFEELVRDELRSAGAVLDLGTGGGEWLLSMIGALPADTVATEGWPPNLSVAHAALEPVGIPVVEYRAGSSGGALPLDTGRFDVVMSRHERFDAVEVSRVLRPSGVFLTQQVAGDDLQGLHQLLGLSSPHASNTLERAVHDVGAAGLEVVRAEHWHGPMQIRSVTGLIRYLRRVPWYAPPDFSVRHDSDILLDAHQRIAASGAPLEFTQSRFLVVARRSALAI